MAIRLGHNTADAQSVLQSDGYRVETEVKDRAFCQAISDDLNRTDIDFQAGSLAQLHEATKTLAKQLEGVLNKRG